MAGQGCSKLRRRLRAGGLLLLGLCLAVGSARGQALGPPRLGFLEGPSEPPAEFSPLTPREPSAVPKTTKDAKVIPARAETGREEESEAKYLPGLLPQSRGRPGTSLPGVSSRGPDKTKGAWTKKVSCRLETTSSEGCSEGGCGPVSQSVGCSGAWCGAGGPSDQCGRFLKGLHECLCCPDPCYEPRWLPLADAAFNTASARPVTQSRARWDAGLNVLSPDRAEFFWARQDGAGAGPRPAAGNLVASNRVRYHDLTYYAEGAAGPVSLIVAVPYRSLGPVGAAHAAGIGDLRVGAKSLVFDCELLQVGFQFLTYLPTGNEGKGLGTGHVSLEPSLLLGLKLGPTTCWQSQVSEWIPVSGDRDYAGAVLHTHHSLNQLLYRFPNADISLVATAELSTWSFQDGAFTDPVRGPFQGAGGVTTMSVGPGLRCFICDRVDFGFAAAFAVTHPHFVGQLYTTEFRIRF